MNRHRTRRTQRGAAIRLAIASPLLAAGLVGCGGDSDSATPVEPQVEATSVVTDTEDTEVIPVTGPVFETVAGGQFDMGSIEGTDTVLWFWAPW